MKSVIIALLMVSGPAMAGFSALDADIQYISWCEDNKVTALDDAGKYVVKADCTTEGLVCKGKPYYLGEGRSFFAASCQKAPQQ